MSTEKVKHDPYAALRIKDFRNFLVFRIFLTIGIQMQSVIIGWQVYAITKDPLALGLVGLAEAIPYISIALFAGHAADVVERKKLILIFNSLLLVSTSFLFLFSTGHLDVLIKAGTFPIYCVVVITGICRGFLGPAVAAFVAQLVPRELYPNSSTWNSTIWHVGAVSGPAIGGLIYGYAGVQNAYVLNLTLLMISIVLILLVKRKPLPFRVEKEKLTESLKAGLKFVFNNQVILSALSLDMLAVFFGGAVALLPVFAAEILFTGPEGLGLLRAAPALGAIFMSVVMAYKPFTKDAGKKLLFSVAAFGLCMIFFAISRNFYLSLFILALSGAVDNVSVVIRSTILQLYTPDNMRGRVASVNSIFIGSSNEIGAFESGVAARLMGVVPSVIFGGGMTIIITGITAKVAKQLRRLEL